MSLTRDDRRREAPLPFRRATSRLTDAMVRWVAATAPAALIASIAGPGLDRAPGLRPGGHGRRR